MLILDCKKLEQVLRDAFVDAEVAVEDFRADGKSVRIYVSSPSFVAVSKVAQHKAVWDLLQKSVDKVLWEGIVVETARMCEV